MASFWTIGSIEFDSDVMSVRKIAITAIFQEGRKNPSARIREERLEVRIPKDTFSSMREIRKSGGRGDKPAGWQSGQRKNQPLSCGQRATHNPITSPRDAWLQSNNPQYKRGAAIEIRLGG